MKLTHVALWTRDLEAAAAFWSTYFDAEIGDQYDSKNRPGFASRFVKLQGNDVRLEIMEGLWVAPHPGEACGWAHLAYSAGSAEHVDEIAERFCRDGLLVSPPRLDGRRLLRGRGPLAGGPPHRNRRVGGVGQVYSEA